MSTQDTFTFKYDPDKETLENTALKSRVIVFDADFVRALTASLTKTFQSGAVVILYQMGLAYGELLGKRILETGGLWRQTQEVYRQRYSSLALGKFHFPSLVAIAASGQTSEIKVTLEDSFVALALGKTGQAECHIVRGLLEGTAKVVLRSDYQCEEAKCLSKGDALCEFSVRPRSKT